MESTKVIKRLHLCLDCPHHRKQPPQPQPSPAATTILHHGLTTNSYFRPVPIHYPFLSSYEPRLTQQNRFTKEAAATATALSIDLGPSSLSGHIVCECSAFAFLSFFTSISTPCLRHSVQPDLRVISYDRQNPPKYALE
jgi:hypothetical protein